MPRILKTSGMIYWSYLCDQNDQSFFLQCVMSSLSQGLRDGERERERLRSKGITQHTSMKFKVKVYGQTLVKGDSHKVTNQK